MNIAGIFSFADGEQIISQEHPQLLGEVRTAIANIDAGVLRTKESKEKTMMGKMLFHPPSINKAFRDALYPLGWKNCKVLCEYSDQFYTPEYKTGKATKGAYRDMDFVKDKLGVEVQLGKYAFMVYNVCAKMTIFRNLGYISAGIEIVPVKALAEEMSTGVSYFEQFVWDLQKRGRADIDVPVLIIGVDA